MEVQDKVLVLPAFLDSTHGQLGCTNCHNGDGTAADRETAHKGMDATPSWGETSVCEDCHAQEVATFGDTLHANLNGIVNPHTSEIAQRSDPAKVDLLTDGTDNHCSSCHTTSCGDCHVSRPASSDGGFLRGHQFLGTPNTVLNCTACHGSRIEQEFMGKPPEEYGQKLSPDVHWIQGQMQCTECHTYEWIHKPQDVYTHRYNDTASPGCADCHDTRSEKFTAVEFHQAHVNVADSSGSAAEERTELQCQVCHSQPYNNCQSCHVGKDDKGLAFYKTESSWYTFKIGKNPAKTDERPYDYTVVRHVPVDENTFSFYGEGILSNFDVLPTWKYATPHNVVLQAPQAETCDSCHGHPELFLGSGDVRADELKANQNVIVDTPPTTEQLKKE